MPVKNRRDKGAVITGKCLRPVPYCNYRSGYDSCTKPGTCQSREELAKCRTRCSATIFGDRGFNYPCQKKPVVTRDGKPYCRIHAPEYIKAKQEKRDAKWAAESKAQQEQWAWEVACNKAVAGLTLEELQKVTPELIRKALRQEIIERAFGEA